MGLGNDVQPLLLQAYQVSTRLRESKALELYNSIIAENTPEQLDVKIEGIAMSLREIDEQLKSGIDMPFEDMLRAEAEYTNKERDINQLLQARDVLATYQTATIEEDAADLQLTYDALQKEIQEGGYYEDIGEFGYWPAIGVVRKVNSSFGTRWDPVTNTSYSYHSGLDVYSPMGTPVGAMFSGTVYRTGYSSGSGYYIYVDHGYGVKSFYCHLSEIKVREGDNVKQKSVIALSGNTGTRTTGPHLHIGIYIDGQAVDPAVVLPCG